MTDQPSPDPTGPDLGADVTGEAGHDSPPPGGEPDAANGEEATGSATDSVADAPPAAEADPFEAMQAEITSLTGDLQRLQADYINYKRRVDRDRDLIRENATYAVLAPIVEVLDTIDRAKEHGPLEDGFKATADQLERIVAGLGLTKFGAPGEAFDPTVHEALSHLGADSEVEVPTVKVLAKAGYKIGDRVVRAAQVLVVDPAE